MNKILFIALLLSLTSCKDRTDTFQFVDKSIKTFENSEYSYPNNTWIKTLRKSSKEQEYQMKVTGRAGYAIFKTYPDLIIYKNFTGDSITLDFLSEFSKLNKEDDVAVLLLQKYSEKIKLEIRNQNKVISLFRNQDKSQIITSIKDSIFTYNNEWQYFEREYQPER